jgi:hypothetical protein
MNRNVAFDKAMFAIYRRAKDEANYNATIFLQMLTETDGLTTAKTLINASNDRECTMECLIHRRGSSESKKATD